MQKGRIILLVFLALFVVDFAFGQGCSQCKLVAEQSTELDEASFGSNINYGILYLMAVPYVLLILIPLLVYRKKVFALLKGRKKG